MTSYQLDLENEMNGEYLLEVNYFICQHFHLGYQNLLKNL